MASELVIVTAIVARLPEPEVQLAAWGVAFAVSTLVQSPSTALLPTSTALANDGATFRRLRRYAAGVLTGLTAVHALVVLTPLYGLLVDGVMGIPVEVSGPARLALLIMLPWTVGTGLRRFLQGVMIRYGHATVVIWGTFVRLGTVAVVLAVGSAFELLPGAPLAAAAIILGVLGEMGYTIVRAGPVVRRHLPLGAPSTLTLDRFFAFFTPLVTMTLLTMAVQTLVTVVLARMPEPLASLAVWPVLFGLLMMLQSPGMAYTEVVISLLRRPHAVAVLRRFTWGTVAAVTVVLVLVAATPLSRLWFERVAGLPPALVDMARMGLLLAVALPGLRVIQSWYQGAIMYGERTRGVSTSVLAFLIVAAALLGAGVAWRGAAGVYVAVVALTVAMAVQSVWLAAWARPVLHAPEPRR